MITYKNVGPDFSIAATGKKYRHGEKYDEIDIPNTNTAWFLPISNCDAVTTIANETITNNAPIVEESTVWNDEEDN